jgi:phage gp36-like protein
MGYASKQDIIDTYSEDLLIRVADLDRDGTPDEEVVSKGLSGADEICNAYLSARYTVPVSPTPGVVKTCAIDIAVYKMAMLRGGRTDEMRLRYEDALKLLEKISTGKVGLGLPPVDEDGDPTTPEVNPNAQRKGRSFETGRA